MAFCIDLCNYHSKQEVMYSFDGPTSLEFQWLGPSETRLALLLLCILTASLLAGQGDSSRVESFSHCIFGTLVIVRYNWQPVRDIEADEVTKRCF